MTIQIGRVSRSANRTCSACPVKLPGSMTEIELSHDGFGVGFVLCPACLVLLEKLIKVERARAVDARAGRK